jgi:hypothetical protein
MKRYWVRRCPKCHTKRRVYHAGSTKKRVCIEGYCKDREHDVWECSQGHQWATITGNLSLMSDLLRAYYIGPISDLFNSSSVFYERMKS